MFVMRTHLAGITAKILSSVSDNPLFDLRRVCRSVYHQALLRSVRYDSPDIHYFCPIEIAYSTHTAFFNFFASQKNRHPSFLSSGKNDQNQITIVDYKNSRRKTRGHKHARSNISTRCLCNEINSILFMVCLMNAKNVVVTRHEMQPHRRFILEITATPAHCPMKWSPFLRK